MDVDPGPLVRAIRTSRVPIAVWVGPSGGKAKGIAALLASAAPVAAVSNGSSIGPADPLRLDEPDATDPGALGREMAAQQPRATAGAPRVAGRWWAGQLSSSEAVQLGATNRVCPEVPGCPTLGDFIVNLDGTTVQTASRSGEAVDREGRRRGRGPAPPAQPGDLVPQARPRRPGDPHAHQPVDRVPAADRRARADRLRVLHDQRRARRRCGGDRADRRVRRLLAPAGHVVGARADPDRDDRVRDRRAGRADRWRGP